MQILTGPVKLIDLKPLAEKMFGSLVKGVTDIEREIVAIDAELHVDLAELLVEQGSKGINLWGFDVFPERTEGNWLEFDSTVNIKPLVNNRSRAIEDLVTRERAETIIKKFIVP